MSRLGGVELVALKRTVYAAWQLECDVIASVQSDHLLLGHAPLINCIIHHILLKFSPCLNKPLTQIVCIVIGMRYTRSCIMPQMQ